MTIRILVVDDHPLMAEGLHNLLESELDMEVVGQANDGNEAVEMALYLQPDVVLLDLMMPGMEPREALQLIRSSLPQTRFLALSMYLGEGLADFIMQSGAHGYVDKQHAAEQLVPAIRAVCRGEEFRGKIPVLGR